MVTTKDSLVTRPVRGGPMVMRRVKGLGCVVV